MVGRQQTSPLDLSGAAIGNKSVSKSASSVISTLGDNSVLGDGSLSR